MDLQSMPIRRCSSLSMPQGHRAPELGEQPSAQRAGVSSEGRRDAGISRRSSGEGRTSPKKKDFGNGGRNIESLFERVLQMMETSEKSHKIVSDEGMQELAKPGAERSRELLAAVARQIRSSSLFSSLPPEVQSFEAVSGLLSDAQLVQADGLGVTFANQGDEIDGLFMVLTGTVSEFRFAIGTLEWEDTNQPLGSGQYFGSLALDHKHSTYSECFRSGPKGAVVIKILKSAMEREMEAQGDTVVRERAQFLKTTYLFSTWPMKRLRQVAALMKPRAYAPKEVVIQQGDPASEFFIILNGSCRVIKQLHVPATDVTKGFRPTPAGTLEPVCPDMALAVERLRAGNFQALRHTSPDKTSAAAQVVQASKHPFDMAAKKGLVSRFNSKEFQRKDAALLAHQKKAIMSRGGQFVSALGVLKGELLQGAGALHAAEPEAAPRGRVKGERSDTSVVSRTKTENVCVEVRELWRGCFFGELSMIQKMPKTASVMASSKCHVLAMTKMDFFRAFDKAALDRFGQLAAELNYVTSDDIIMGLLHHESSWTEYKQKVATEALFGNVFLNDRYHDTQIAPLVDEDRQALDQRMHYSMEGALDDGSPRRGPPSPAPATINSPIGHQAIPLRRQYPIKSSREAFTDEGRVKAVRHLRLRKLSTRGSQGDGTRPHTGRTAGDSRGMVGISRGTMGFISKGFSGHLTARF